MIVVENLSCFETLELCISALRPSKNKVHFHLIFMLLYRLGQVSFPNGDVANWEPSIVRREEILKIKKTAYNPIKIVC